MPLSPGAFQFEPEQSIEMARRVSVQAASADLPPLPHRFPALAQPAPQITPRAAVRHEATSSRPVVVLLIKSPQNEAAALNSADPA
jgi:hypothetical protein